MCGSTNRNNAIAIKAKLLGDFLNLLNVKTIKSGEIQENCYVVYDSSDNGLIIDPGENREEIASYINEKDINALAIINTHAHYDHIGSV